MKTNHQCVSTISQCLRATAVSRAILALGIAGGFSLALAQQSAQPTFPSAGAATQSLFQAVQNNDEQTIASILGGPSELTSSHDPGVDKADRELFVEKYQEMHRLSRESDGSVTLYIGAEATIRLALRPTHCRSARKRRSINEAGLNRSSGRAAPAPGRDTCLPATR